MALLARRAGMAARGGTDRRSDHWGDPSGRPRGAGRVRRRSRAVHRLPVGARLPGTRGARRLEGRGVRAIGGLALQLAVEPGLDSELLAQARLVVGVHRHDPAGAQVLASEHETGPGGPPAASVAVPDVPPGKIGFYLRDPL